MSSVTVCYDCKHPIQIREDQGILVQPDELDPNPSIYEDIMKAERILSLASNPDSRQILCCNCLDKLVESIENILNEKTNKKKLLENQLELIQQQIDEDNTEEPSNEEIIKLEEEFSELKIKEKLQNKEFKALNSELIQLIDKEKKFWLEANALESKLIEFEESNAEVLQRIKVAENEFSMLTKINILNDMFYISSENQIGTISGLRLGRLESEIVQWEEINAAWGQCVLLLSTLSRLKGFKSAQCNLYPLGSFSRVSPVHNDGNRYELFCSDSTLPVMSSRFNTGQTLFLEALFEFSLFMESEDRNLKMPYEIRMDFIGETRIILNSGNKEEWTRALKYMLQDLKYLVTVCIRDFK